MKYLIIFSASLLASVFAPESVYACDDHHHPHAHTSTPHDHPSADTATPHPDDVSDNHK